MTLVMPDTTPEIDQSAELTCQADDCERPAKVLVVAACECRPLWCRPCLELWRQRCLAMERQVKPAKLITFECEGCGVTLDFRARWQHGYLFRALILDVVPL